MIDNGQVWMDMINARNQTAHTYNQDVAVKIVYAISIAFFPAFEELERTFIKFLKNQKSE